MAAPCNCVKGSVWSGPILLRVPKAKPWLGRTSRTYMASGISFLHEDRRGEVKQGSETKRWEMQFSYEKPGRWGNIRDVHDQSLIQGTD